VFAGFRQVGRGGGEIAVRRCLVGLWADVKKRGGGGGKCRSREQLATIATVPSSGELKRTPVSNEGGEGGEGKKKKKSRRAVQVPKDSERKGERGFNQVPLLGFKAAARIRPVVGGGKGRDMAAVTSGVRFQPFRTGGKNRLPIAFSSAAPARP